MENIEEEREVLYKNLPICNSFSIAKCVVSMDSNYSKFLLSSKEYNRLRQIENKYSELKEKFLKLQEEKERPTASKETGNIQSGFGNNLGKMFFKNLLKLYFTKSKEKAKT